MLNPFMLMFVLYNCVTQHLIGIHISCFGRSDLLPSRLIGNNKSIYLLHKKKCIAVTLHPSHPGVTSSFATSSSINGERDGHRKKIKYFYCKEYVHTKYNYRVVLLLPLDLNHHLVLLEP